MTLENKFTLKTPGSVYQLKKKTFLLLKKNYKLTKIQKKPFFLIKLKIIKRPYLAIIVSEIFAVKLFRDS